MNKTMLPYLSDETLTAVMHDLDLARGDLRFRGDRRPLDLALQEEWAAVERAWLTAKAERTARLAIDKNIRRYLSDAAPAEAGREAEAAAPPPEVAP